MGLRNASLCAVPAALILGAGPVAAQSAEEIAQGHYDAFRAAVDCMSAYEFRSQRLDNCNDEIEWRGRRDVDEAPLAGTPYEPCQMMAFFAATRVVVGMSTIDEAGVQRAMGSRLRTCPVVAEGD